LNIGVALYPHDAENFDQLFNNAFSAHNRCRYNTEDSYCFYDSGQSQVATQRLIFERDIRNAIKNNSFEFFYQPKVSLADGSLLGFESLCRWKEQTTNQFISPEIFIPLIEELGMISELCEQAMLDAAKLLKNCIHPLNLNIRIAINLSPLQFKSNQFVSKLKSIMNDNGLSPNNFDFEVTEGALIHDFDQTVDSLKEINEMGCHISLDDFGTGYSSMQYLKKLPINNLKIDKSFVMDMHEDESDKTFVKAIIAMAHGLGLSVIAEGVELDQHWELLKEWQCNVAQGYLISRPISSDELKYWILQYQAKLSE